MDFKEHIAELLHHELGLEKKSLRELIEIPSDQQLGDYALPCFFLAKQYKKSPFAIALDLQDKLTKKHLVNGHPHIERIIATGPYLNFFVDKERYVKIVLSKIMQEKKAYGLHAPHHERVMIEFSQPNTHKEFHVGHLRNVAIGDSLVRIYTQCGYDVIAANYIGDMGTHVAKALWCYQTFHKQESPTENKGKYIGRMYAEASKKLEENELEYAPQVSQMLQKIEQHDPTMIALWNETRQWSLDQFTAIYNELGVHFDVYFYESQEEKEGKRIVERLKQSGIVVESEGALLVDLKSYGLDVFLVLKRDGTSLYSTKDLALASKKFEEYHITKSFYVVDARQSFYFQQLFKTLELMGFKKEMHHIAYDFVTTPEGPMASRHGNVILYEDLREKVHARMEEETLKRHPDWPAARIFENAHRIMLSALKFGMLKYDIGRIIVFDIDAWLNFEGETGPYIEYSYARINSIFRKLAKDKEVTDIESFIAHPDYAVLNAANELAIIKLLDTYPATIDAAAKEFKPSLIAHYLLELTQKFNEFYHANPILIAEDKVMKARLSLIYCIREVLASGMKLLGIEPIEEM